LSYILRNIVEINDLYYEIRLQVNDLDKNIIFVIVIIDRNKIAHNI